MRQEIKSHLCSFDFSGEGQHSLALFTQQSGHGEHLNRLIGQLFRQTTNVVYRQVSRSEILR